MATIDTAGPDALTVRGALRAWAELAGLWSLAIAWPVYQRLTAGTESLTAIGVRRLDLILFIVLVSLAIPLLLTMIEFGISAAARRPRLQRVIHAILAGLLVALWIWQQIEAFPGLLKVLLPLAALALFIVAYLRTDFARTFTGLLALATPVVIVLFAFSYPVKQELFPGEPAQAAQSTDSETPVVIVVLDELPLASLMTDDHQIDRRFFPALADLSRESTWYRRALSVADNTLSAVPAMLSGEPPTLDHHDPPGRRAYPDTICSTAERAGYELYSSELLTDFCAQDPLGTRLSALLKQGLPAAQPAFLPDSLKLAGTGNLTPGRFLEDGAERLAELFPEPDDTFGVNRDRSFKAFTEGLPDGGRSMSVLHIALPHAEYQYLPDGRIYGNRDLGDVQTATNFANPVDRRESAKNLQQMTSQMMYTDKLIGELIDHMKEAGTWDDTLFVLTADHGVSFTSGSLRRSLDRRNAGWLMPVPLFIKYPGESRGKIVDAEVDSRDIEPTVLGELGLDPNPRTTGRDLATADLEPRGSATAISSTANAVTLPRDKIDAEENAAVRWRNRVFSSRRLNAIGGHGDLLGKPVSGLPRLRPLEFEPIPGATYDNVILDAPSGPAEIQSVPAYFQASLPGVKRDPGPIAVSLNGKVAGTTRAWRRDGVWMTGVNLEESGFVQGRNTAKVYAIEPSP